MVYFNNIACALFINKSSWYSCLFYRFHAHTRQKSFTQEKKTKYLKTHLNGNIYKFTVSVREREKAKKKKKNNENKDGVLRAMLCLYMQQRCAHDVSSEISRLADTITIRYFE